jgi:hypothetical protein
MTAGKVQHLFRALAAESVEYVLAGAVALDVLGIGRFTEDIDLFVRPSEDNVARLRRALRAAWDDPSIEEIRRTSPATIRSSSTSHPTGPNSTSVSARDRFRVRRSLRRGPPLRRRRRSGRDTPRPSTR